MFIECFSLCITGVVMLLVNPWIDNISIKIVVGNACNFVKSRKLGFSGQSEKPAPILRSG